MNRPDPMDELLEKLMLTLDNIGELSDNIDELYERLLKEVEDRR